MKRFEYKLVPQKQMEPGSLWEAFDKLGAEGWELCGIDWGCCIFKREIILSDEW